MKRCLIIVIISALILLGGCSQSSGTKTSDGLQKISIMLDWYPNAVHSAIYTAAAKGYFAKEGLDVDIKMPSETTDPLKLVAAGKVDLAISYQPQVVMARAEGIPVVSVAAIVREPLNYLMVPKNSGITRPRELEGKNIGYSSLEFEQAVLKTMVKKDGGNPNKVKTTDVGFDLIPAITSKKVDGIDGGYINHEKILLEKEGHPVNAFNPADYGVPNYYELILITSEKEMKQKQSVIKKFWSAVAKGQAAVTKDPNAALKTLYKHEDSTFPLDHQVETKSLHILLPLMNNKTENYGHQDLSVWNNITSWLYKKGMIDKKIDVKKAYVNLD
ncbi:ABC transporter substrate-binding protein [Bacillus sp. APMAM]|nr:ABC transporter substrate-binding protein [Bacillus sp. APMAM]RTZ56376.1 ABC transporter substrate-binding protein [Bacillus sp. SAJ1]